MAQEGIATLPQSPENAPPPEMALDAGKNELLQKFGPEAMAEYENTMSQAAGQLNLPIEQLQQLQQIIDYILKNYQNYPQIRKELLAQGLREEDLPPEFDAGYFGSMQVMVSEALKRAQGQAPQTADQGPPMQAPEGSPLQVPPQGFAKGGLAGAAESLRQKGRNGDTILAHINPQEAAFLKSMGGSGKLNPNTGLPEFGGWLEKTTGISVGDAWSSVKAFAAPILKSPVGKIAATVALTYALGPAGGALMSAPMAAAVAAGSITALGGGDLKTSLISAATGYGMAYLAPQISGMLPGAGDAVTGAAPSFLNAVMTGGAMGTGYGLLTGQNLQSSLKMGLTGGAIAGAANYLQAGPYAPKEGAPGAPITDNSQAVTLQPDGSYAPSNAVDAAMPDPYSIGDYANRVTAQGGALTPDQVSATNPGGGIGQTDMQNWLNQQMPGGVESAPGYGSGLGASGRFVNGTYQPSPAIAPGGASALQSANNTASFMGEQNYNPLQTTTGPSPTTLASLPPGTTVPGGPATAPSSGIEDYYTKAKDYLFSSDKANPGLFMAKDGSLSIPMATGAALGIATLTGGFKTASPSTTANSAYTGIERDASGQPVTGSDLLEKDPDKYVYKPNIKTAPPVDPYNNNSTNPNDVNVINTRQFGQARQNPYGTFTPPAMSGGQPIGGNVFALPQPYNTAGMYDFMRQNRGYAEGGISEIYPRRTGGISGPGTSTSDDIPAMLSDGEFVITAKAVKGAGKGSRREGAKKLYRMMHALEKKAK
jgi:hypothetical protein